MDPEAFLEIANQIYRLQMYPFFEMAHCLVMCMYVKEDLAGGAHLFSRKHPLTCWITCMLSIYGGAMLANFLLGEPILSSFKNQNSLLLATAAWYVIFYTPFDIGYLIMIIIGTLKGNGTAFLKVLERLLRGVWTPNAIELVQISFPTKACIAASFIFVLDKKTEIISAPHALVYFGVVIFFVYFKMSSMLLGIHDPFVPFENLFCAIFLGGIWDTLARLLTPASKGDHTSTKSDTAKDGKQNPQRKKIKTFFFFNFDVFKHC
ncbi:trimeric intracellular cation channel type 1B.1 [Caerostris extrusa]|uniref:Trimeric intracellular cation channel type 1B.1 n=1 Tax=Caerostris extrusa TaxID=172846 RepID=A0AAV4Y4M4_CAEEX|nr:trimeric intracellular cation channel type 1B.1 [Caerostris extrusa]